MAFPRSYINCDERQLLKLPDHVPSGFDNSWVISSVSTHTQLEKEIPDDLLWLNAFDAYGTYLFVNSVNGFSSSRWLWRVNSIAKLYQEEKERKNTLCMLQQSSSVPQRLTRVPRHGGGTCDLAPLGWGYIKDRVVADTRPHITSYEKSVKKSKFSTVSSFEKKKKKVFPKFRETNSWVLCCAMKPLAGLLSLTS